jgi:hypothetical protein
VYHRVVADSTQAFDRRSAAVVMALTQAVNCWSTWLGGLLEVDPIEAAMRPELAAAVGRTFVAFVDCWQTREPAAGLERLVHLASELLVVRDVRMAEDTLLARTLAGLPERTEDLSFIVAGGCLSQRENCLFIAQRSFL